jgi:radical SAM superfamily enzyme YgiQ (UPF0313 family)
VVDVLLTHSYHLLYDPKQVRKMQPYPPLGTLYAASVLRQQGLSVALFDTMLEDPVDGFPQALERYRPQIVALYEDDFNFLTKMCLTRMREVAWEMALQSRAIGALVIAHGSDASDHSAEYLQHGFDSVIGGEAEWKLADVCCRFAKSDGANVLQDRSHAHSPSMYGLPLPARDLVDMDRYRRAWHGAHHRFSLNLVSSRGCPFRCNWCAKPIFGDSFHVRPALEVAEEMRLLRDVYGAEHLWFADDIFALNHHWAAEFGAEVERLNCAIPFKAQCRADLMTADTVDALRRAGCEEVWMGVESGSQKILDAMDKGLEIGDVFLATARLRRAGIRPCFFLQFGYPGETLDDIEQTISMVRQARPHDIGVSLSYPLPNTRFYQMIRERMGSKQNWRDSDDLSLMFQGAYSDEFYRALRNALHAEVAETSAGNASPKLAGSSVRSLWQRVADLEPVSPNPNPTRLDRDSTRTSQLVPTPSGFVSLQALAPPGGTNG